MKHLIYLFSSIFIFLQGGIYAQGWQTNAGGDLYVTGTKAGIGTSGPEQSLHIDKGELKISHDTNAPTIRLYDSADDDQFTLRHHRTGDRFEINSGAGNLLSVAKEGLVGIGSQNPDSELTVNGEIRAVAFKVSNEIPADYVFQKYYTGKSELLPGYRMPPLKEVEAFIKAKHHLPGIPSAEAIKKNGLDAGKMTNRLLQKVEELTLYLIGQRKKLERIQQHKQ
ncbi:hypothetical protein LS482_07240 [Sinomicrobium kalidii]|uniref:hypothetical protein n=1 Tax=Sinomicrobium kalidii TaxID=2900738 RepID=UPI001E2E66B1|nr:hypothetical protein [Sinomicrobium kalidii]UGU17662.1 hypothetical protein LS482_07240 [Sinomicrobium kalidii]